MRASTTTDGKRADDIDQRVERDEIHAGIGDEGEFVRIGLCPSSGTGEKVESATISTKMPNERTVSMNI